MRSDISYWYMMISLPWRDSNRTQCTVFGIYREWGNPNVQTAHTANTIDNFREIPVSSCGRKLVHVPTQEKVHRKKCLLPDTQQGTQTCTTDTHQGTQTRTTDTHQGTQTRTTDTQQGTQTPNKVHRHTPQTPAKEHRHSPKYTDTHQRHQGTAEHKSF